MLIVEVILTIVAWTRGWKGYALIPIAIGLPIAIGGGYLVAVSGGSEKDLAWLIILDVIFIIVLVGMVIKKRENKTAISSESRNIMYCYKCGTRNDSNAFRCVNCGIVIQQMPPTDN